MNAACPVCACPILPEESITRCPGCETPHHGECWAYNEGCGIYACPGVAVEQRAPAPLPAWDVAVGDRRFRFHVALADLIPGLRGRVAAALVACAALALAAQAAPELAVAGALLGLLLAALAFLGLEARFDGRHREVAFALRLRERTFPLGALPLARATRVDLTPLAAEAGEGHRTVLRATVRLVGGGRLRLWLDPAAARVREGDVDHWALALRLATGVPVVRAGRARRPVLRKRVLAFQEALDAGAPLAPDAARLWAWRWLWYPAWSLAPTVLLGGVPSIPDGLLLAGALTAALAAGTLLLALVRPATLLGSTGEAAGTSPYPALLRPENAKEVLTGMQSFLAFVEEQDLPPLWPEAERREVERAVRALFLAMPALALATWLLGPLGWFLVGLHLLASAATGAALLRARWSEDFVRGWLGASRAVLERPEQDVEGRIDLGDGGR